MVPNNATGVIIGLVRREHASTVGTRVQELEGSQMEPPLAGPTGAFAHTPDRGAACTAQRSTEHRSPFKLLDHGRPDLAR